MSTSFYLFLRPVLLQGRTQGGPGVPVTPPLQAFFNQTTYNRWKKRLDDILAIVKRPFF